ncbi:hypothetical protein JCM11251_005900 [Rhodosporidiobolus azoricus]
MTGQRRHEQSIGYKKTERSGANLAAAFASSTLSDLPPPVSPLPSLSGSASPSVPSPTSTLRTTTAGEEVESLFVTTDSPPELVFPQRKGSLTPSTGTVSDTGRSSLERRLDRRLSGDGKRRFSADGGRRPSADSGRRSSTDGGSLRSNRSGHDKGGGSGHRVNPGAKHYFPLVQMPKKARASPPPVSAETQPVSALSSPSKSAEFSATNTTASSSAKRSNSVSSAPPARPAVFPTITPNRQAGAAITPSVFPTVRRSSAAQGASRDETASVRSTSTPSIASEAYPSPDPSSPVRPYPTTSASSPARHSSPPSSSYAPSIAPSTRSRSTIYAPSIAPSHAPSQARSYAPSASYAPSTTSSDGPVSIFLNPEAQKRPLTDLLPKKKLTSLFSRDKNKNAAQLGAPRVGPDGMTYRGKSASVLDAALATSLTWATKRGEQQRSFASTSAAFGPPAGYRPAHVMQRQREEAAAAAIAAGPGGIGGEPLSADALAAALAQGGRRPSVADSMMTVDSVGVYPGGGDGRGGGPAFPVRQQPVFATKPRTRPEGEETPTETGLGIS